MQLPFNSLDFVRDFVNINTAVLSDQLEVTVSALFSKEKEENDFRIKIDELELWSLIWSFSFPQKKQVHTYCV